jgi:phosphopantothenoylcysteine synthetase/decarboxylase
MHLLVTAGNTVVPIDRVRCLTNIFTGRTGAGIALHGYERGHAITLLTSHPKVVSEPQHSSLLAENRWDVRIYRTFEDLARQMEDAIKLGRLDGVIHCAAVSDYQPGGIYAPAPGTRFAVDTNQWQCSGPTPAALVDRSARKVKSDEPELWLRLVRTPKLVDAIRSAWGFRGILVKFKLEVGLSDERLLDIAERSRQQSAADLMVANTLEGTASWAFLGPLAGKYDRIERPQLPSRLLDEVERLHREHTHG